MYPVKVQVYQLQSSFMICVIEFVNHSCLIMDANGAVLWYFELFEQTS